MKNSIDFLEVKKTMFLEKFKLEDMASNNQKGFAKELLVMLDYLNPPFIDSEKFSITLEEDRGVPYIKLSIPHRTESGFDLFVTVDDTEVIVFFGEAHQHFNSEDYDKKSDWIADAVGFLSEILHGSFEIHSFYKGDKAAKVKVYHINEDGEKRFISSCNNLSFISLNPFLKSRKEVKIVTFFDRR